MIFEHYASDDTVSRASRLGRKITRAEHVHTLDEVRDSCFAYLWLVNGAMRSVMGYIPVSAAVNFLFVGNGASPFHVARIGNDEFLILVDPRALDCLCALVERTVSSSPIAERFGLKPMVPNPEYSGLFLLDIAKAMMFQDTDKEEVQGPPNVTFISTIVMFIISHEYAHIAHGHFDFLDSADADEFKKETDDFNLTMRTFEMDADSSALTSTHAACENFRNNGFNEMPQSVDPIVSIDDYRLAYLISITLAHIYLDALTTNFYPKQHPITYVRYLTFTGVLQRVMKFDENLIEEARLLLVATFENLNGGNPLGYPIASNAVEIGPDGELLERYLEVVELIGASEIDQYVARWARLHPFLKKYLRGGNLAPPVGTPA